MELITLNGMVHQWEKRRPKVSVALEPENLFLWVVLGSVVSMILTVLNQ